MNIRLIVPLVGSIAGLLGAIVHVSLTNTATPVLVNQFLGMWYAINLCIISFQTYLIQRYPSNFYLNIVYYIIGAVTNFVAIVCYGIVEVGGSGAAVAWAVLATGWSIFGFYILREVYRNRKDAQTNDKESQKRCNQFRCYCHAFLLIIHIVFAILLTVGAVTIANVYQAKAPGKVNFDLGLKI